MLIEHRGKRPTVDPSAYVAPTAVLCGDVHVSAGARVLFGAVLWQVWRVVQHTSDSAGQMSAVALLFAVTAQIALGIWTLLAQVPIELGLAHQAGAVTVFWIAVWHLHALSRRRHVPT